MKKVLILLLVILCCLTTACQQIPESSLANNESSTNLQKEDLTNTNDLSENDTDNSAVSNESNPAIEEPSNIADDSHDLVNEPVQEEPAEGTGGDSDGCIVHQFFYHAIDGNWTTEEIQLFIETYKDTEGKYADGYNEDYNIVNFVRLHNLTREEFIKQVAFPEDLDQLATRHHPQAKYTYRQFVDAIFGDDPELTEWIFSADVNK